MLKAGYLVVYAEVFYCMRTTHMLRRWGLDWMNGVVRGYFQALLLCGDNDYTVVPALLPGTLRCL
jgi:hypothetical protein